MKKKLMLFLVVLNFAFAKNLIVLEPATLEILYLLGAEDKILATYETRGQVEPIDKVTKLNSIGTYVKPNLEKIIELKPDLVITSDHSRSIIPDLDRFNIEHMEIKTRSIDDIFKNIKTIAKIVDKEKKGDELVESFHKKLNDIDWTKAEGKSAIFFFGTSNLMSFGKDTFPGSMLTNMKMKNLAEKLEGNNPIISTELLLEEDVDYMVYISSKGTVEEFLKQHPVLKHTSAAKNGNIIIARSHNLLRGVPRVIDEMVRIYEEFLK